MTQVAIIGLGQIGTSIGLALGEHPKEFHRLGYDRESGRAKLAKKMGALDKAVKNLSSAVTKADIVILALPMHELQGTLSSITSSLKEGALVLDTAPLPGVTGEWGRQRVPDGRHYLAFTPFIGPRFLNRFDAGTEAADADLFQRGSFAITASAGTDPAAIQMAADLAEKLQAAPYFADPTEIDSFMAATHLLPQLLAAALTNATVEQPGWKEGRKAAGKAFALATHAISNLDEPSALALAAVNDKQSLTRALDNLLLELQRLRDQILNDERDELEERLGQGREEIGKWWAQRLALLASWGRHPQPLALVGPQLPLQRLRLGEVPRRLRHPDFLQPLQFLAHRFPPSKF